MYENPPIISHFRYGNVSDEIFLTFFGKIFAGKEKVCIFAVLFGKIENQFTSYQRIGKDTFRVAIRWTAISQANEFIISKTRMSGRMSGG